LQTAYLNEEANSTEPSPSVRVPWIDPWRREIKKDSSACRIRDSGTGCFKNVNN